MHSSSDDDPGVQAAQPQLAADPGVDETPRVRADRAANLAQPRWGWSETSMTAEPRASPGAGGQVRGAEVQIDVELSPASIRRSGSWATSRQRENSSRSAACPG